MKSCFTIFFLLIHLLVSKFTDSYAQVQWTKDYNNPVFAGAIGTWYEHVLIPFVLYNDDSSRYEMWFTASTDGFRPYCIGFATSDDGINWNAHSSPVLEPEPGTWDESTVEIPMVLLENGQYKMWYTGWSPSDDNSKIGYATSHDGINWQRDTTNNPIMVPVTAAWEEAGPAYPSILSVEGGYKMWYSGYNAGLTSAMIGYATSQDGINWQRDSTDNPILHPGSSGEWDDAKVDLGYVLLVDSTYHMWFVGRPTSGSPQQVGYASSSDGFIWNKYDDPNTTNLPYSESDPVLSPTKLQWDGIKVQRGSVMLIGDTLHMWYSGYGSPFSSHPFRIGHATSPYGIPDGIDTFDDSSIPERYTLSQNYPNPFNPITNIQFLISKTEFVTLKVYNLLGQEVATLVSEKLTPGNYTYMWDASNFASGIYYYRIAVHSDKSETYDFSETRKMILLR